MTQENNLLAVELNVPFFKVLQVKSILHCKLSRKLFFLLLKRVNSLYACPIMNNEVCHISQSDNFIIIPNTELF